MIRALFIILFLCWCHIANSQVISYGLLYDNSNVTHHLSSIDMISDNLNIIYNPNNVGIIVNETSVINTSNNHYLFEGRRPGTTEDHYFAIDINTGLMDSDTLAPDDIRMLQIHPTTNIVYGLWFNSSTGTHHLCSVDMYTGQKTVIDNSNDVGIVTGGTAVINPLTNTYDFEARYPSSGVDRYFSIDLTTGNHVNDTIAPDDIRMLQIHPTTNIVYGLWYTGNQHHLVSLDMLTGQKTVINTSNNIGTVTYQTAIIDPNINSYLFKGNYSSSTVDRYFSLNLSSGNIMSDTLATDDIRALKYYVPTTGINNSVSEISYFISPNPCNENCKIEINNLNGCNYEFKMYDCLGRQVRSISNIENYIIQIKRGNLTSGIYSFMLAGSDGSIGWGKLLIND